MDFRTAKQIGQDIEAEFDQLKFTGGYDHNYVTDNYAKGNRRLIATAYSDKTGIAMDVTSDCPCVQFYAANFVENEHGKNGHTYNKRVLSVWKRRLNRMRSMLKISTPRFLMQVNSMIL